MLQEAQSGWQCAYKTSAQERYYCEQNAAAARARNERSGNPFYDGMKEEACDGSDSGAMAAMMLGIRC